MGFASDLDALLALFGIEWTGSKWKRSGNGRPNPPSQTSLERSTFKFRRVMPFGRDVAHYDERVKMLNRLASDPAVRHVMVKRKYTVGILTELHPTIGPETKLTGLNVGAGRVVSTDPASAVLPARQCSI